MMVNGNPKWFQTCWKKSSIALGASIVLTFVTGYQDGHVGKFAYYHKDTTLSGV
jgi:hypothetical protein